MINPLDFSGPYLKTERAEHHIDDLEGIFKRHIARNKKAMIPKYNRKPRGISIGTGLPRHTPTILGDAIHNLRASLDHAYCELVKANGHTVHERSFFPAVNPNGRDSWESRKAMVEGQEKDGHGPGLAVIKALSDDVQPYVGGKGEDLARLHGLDIADKHMILLPTEAHMHIEDIKFTNGSAIRGITLAGPLGSEAAIAFGVGAGLDPNHNSKAIFDICFGGGQPYEGEPIIPVMRALTRRVNDTLHLLEQRAAETN